MLINIYIYLVQPMVAGKIMAYINSLL